MIFRTRRRNTRAASRQLRHLGATLLVLLLATGCGSSGRTASVPPHPPGCGKNCGNAGPPGTTVPRAAPPPGCSSYCLNAGPEGGPNPNECPSVRSGGACTPCPQSNCLSLADTTAPVHNGIAIVRLTCRITRPCVGAFLMLVPGREVAQTGARLAPSQRVAQADLRIQPGQTSDVPVALTPMGKRVLASSPNGYGAEPYAALDPYGAVLASFGGQPSPKLVLVAQ
jgi:hypothetical protein